MKIFKIIFTIALIVVVFFFYLYFTSDDAVNTSGACGSYEKMEVVLNQKSSLVDIADNECKREQGLSNRKSVSENKGMLFLFEKSGNHGIWMKEMNFPIDILWLNENKEVIAIENSISPDTFPQIYGQNIVSKYVLEIKAGEANKNEIKVGNKIYFDEI